MDLFGNPRESFAAARSHDSGLPKMPDAKNRAYQPHRAPPDKVARELEATPSYLPVRPLMVKRVEPGAAEGAHSTFRKAARAISGDASCGKAAALGIGEANHTRSGIVQAAVADWNRDHKAKPVEVERRRLNMSWVAEPSVDKTVPGARGKMAPR